MVYQNDALDDSFQKRCLEDIQGQKSRKNCQKGEIVYCIYNSSIYYIQVIKLNKKVKFWSLIFFKRKCHEVKKIDKCLNNNFLWFFILFFAF